MKFDRLDRPGIKSVPFAIYSIISRPTDSVQKLLVLQRPDGQGHLGGDDVIGIFEVLVL